MNSNIEIYNSEKIRFSSLQSNFHKLLKLTLHRYLLDSDLGSAVVGHMYSGQST